MIGVEQGFVEEPRPLNWRYEERIWMPLKPSSASSSRASCFSWALVSSSRVRLSAPDACSQPEPLEVPASALRALWPQLFPRPAAVEALRQPSLSSFLLQQVSARPPPLRLELRLWQRGLVLAEVAAVVVAAVAQAASETLKFRSEIASCHPAAA